MDAAGTVFAKLGDLEERWRPLGGEEGARAAVLLGDASDMLLAAYEERFGCAYEPDARPSFDRAAPAVCCAMVRRAMGVPDGFAGATQMSQGGGGYTASVSFGGALGDLYLGKSDLKRLGLTGSTIRAITPVVRDD